MSDDPTQSYRFKSFRLDVEERRLLDNGTPVPLTPKAFDLLVVLVERSSHLVEKKELMQLLWADSFVEDANLTRTIHTLRRALGEDNENKFIETVAKKGYRFVADVNPAVDAGNERDETSVAFSNGFLPKEPEAPAKLEAVEKAAITHRSPRIVFGTLAAIVILSLAALLASKWAAEKPPGGVENPVSLVVLPFLPIKGGERDDAYELGFAQSLIVQLNQEKNLRVTPFPSIRSFKDLEQDSIAIGRQLKADYVLESTYVGADSRLKITSQLLNVQSGAVEQTFEYEDSDASRFIAGNAIVAKIAPDILAKLNVVSTGPAAKWGTTEEAWRQYNRGTTLTNQRNYDSAIAAIGAFEEAIRIDPNYALAYVGLAFAHTTARVNGGKTEIHCPKAREAVEHALQIDPNNAEGYSVRGLNQHSCQWDQAAAEASHRKALELGPNSSSVHRFYGVFLTHLGRAEESIAEEKKAIDLDPTLAFNEKMLGRAMFFAKRYEDAIAQLKRARDFDSNDFEQAELLSQSYDFIGQSDEALNWFLVAETIRRESADQIADWKATYALSGWQGVLLKRMEREEKKGDNANFGLIARLAARLGDKEKAFSFIDKELPRNSLFVVQMLVEPDLDSLRSDPRMDEILTRLGYK